jgi:hypothetical protein
MGLCGRSHSKKSMLSRNHEEGLNLLALPTRAKCVSQLALSVTGVRRLARMETEPPSQFACLSLVKGFDRHFAVLCHTVLSMAAQHAP